MSKKSRKERLARRKQSVKHKIYINPELIEEMQYTMYTKLHRYHTKGEIIKNLRELAVDGYIKIV